MKEAERPTRRETMPAIGDFFLNRNSNEGFVLVRIRPVSASEPRDNVCYLHRISDGHVVGRFQYEIMSQLWQRA